MKIEMRKVILLPIVLLSIFILIGCSQTPTTPPSPSFMVFDDVEYVTEFTPSFNLLNKTVQDIDVIGITDLSIYESNLDFYTIFA